MAQRRRAAEKPSQVGGSPAYGYNNILLLTEGELNRPTDITTNQSHFRARGKAKAISAHNGINPNFRMTKKLR